MKKTIEEEILEVLPYPTEKNSWEIWKDVQVKRRQAKELPTKPDFYLSFSYLLLHAYEQGCFWKLHEMEAQGWLESRFVDGPFPRTLLFRKTGGGTKRLNELKAKSFSEDNSPKAIPGLI